MITKALLIIMAVLSTMTSKTPPTVTITNGEGCLFVGGVDNTTLKNVLRSEVQPFMAMAAGKDMMTKTKWTTKTSMDRTTIDSLLTTDQLMDRLLVTEKDIFPVSLGRNKAPRGQEPEEGHCHYQLLNRCLNRNK
ncbi:hypothetical protein BDP27DRAFT_1310394 [Rhodocollybia butyracea]|uniref:Uncharacterized protein n=1 Tax=Rhodocollybia butyracea TaxID=206335 RepID=A0A9P5QAX1_9AGAR|nr:hypothetical protein BDP27DRAFT_1310394 [Rhodocollybia butyracea]